jgi:hypothetical protein
MLTAMGGLPADWHFAMERVAVEPPREPALPGVCSPVTVNNQDLASLLENRAQLVAELEVVDADPAWTSVLGTLPSSPTPARCAVRRIRCVGRRASAELDAGSHWSWAGSDLLIPFRQR